MGLREIGWIVFLAGLPFAHLLFRPLDIWHGHAAWAQLGSVLCFAWSLGRGGVLRPNRPLAAFLAWAGLLSLWIWVSTMRQSHVYPIQLLKGVTHLLLLVLLYVAAMLSWTPRFLDQACRVLAYVGVVILAYCGLQLLNLDQFFHHLAESIETDEFVGVIGNPSHLAIHLCLLLPLFLLQKGWRWKLVAGVCSLMILRAGSSGGYLAFFGVMSWWAWHQCKPLLWVVGGVVLLGIVWVYFNPGLLNPLGRYPAWTEFWRLFAMQPITGQGPGFVSDLSMTITNVKSPIYQWRHAHNEYFQIAIEYGIIGLSAFGWLLYQLGQDIRRLPKTPLVVALSGMLIAVGINSFVNFPLHLWATGSLVLLAYGGIQVLVESKC